MRRESFEHFYLTKIALAEGCGCAEHVTRMREVDAYAERRRFTHTGMRTSDLISRMAKVIGSMLGRNRI